MSDVVLRPTTPPAPLYLKGIATIKGVGDPRTRFEAGLHMMHANADQVRVFLYNLGSYTSSFVCVCVCLLLLPPLHSCWQQHMSQAYPLQPMCWRSCTDCSKPCWDLLLPLDDY